MPCSPTAEGDASSGRQRTSSPCPSQRARGCLCAMAAAQICSSPCRSTSNCRRPSSRPSHGAQRPPVASLRAVSALLSSAVSAGCEDAAMPSEPVWARTEVAGGESCSAAASATSRGGVHRGQSWGMAERSVDWAGRLRRGKVDSVRWGRQRALQLSKSG
jgi:hypothetical protein